MSTSSEKRPRGEGTPSVDLLVAEALRLLDEEGFAALTTRRLAARLNIHQPRIYRRIADRDELLGLVCDAIMAEVALPSSSLPTRVWLEEVGVALRQAWSKHPHAVPLLHYGGARPAISQLLDKVVSVMQSNDLADDRLLAALQAFLGYVFGVILLEGREGAARTPPLVDALSFPHLNQLQQRVLQEPVFTSDTTFRDGLGLLLDGIFSPLGAPAAEAPLARA